MNEFTRAYIECALWASCDFNDVPLDKNYSVEDIAVRVDGDNAVMVRPYASYGRF